MARGERAGSALSAAGRRPNARWLLSLVPFVGLLIGVGFVVAWVDVREVGATLLGADLPWVVAAACLALAATGIVAAKLFMVVRIVDVPRSVGQCWSAVMAGLSLNAVLPARGGDLVRALFLAREPNTLTILVGAVLLERLFDVATLGALVVVASLLAGAGPFDSVTLIGAAVVGAAAVGGTLLAVLGPRTPFRPDLGERLARAVRQCVARPAFTVSALALSALAWVNNALLMLCALRAVGASPPPLVAMRAALTAVLAGVAPVSVSGIGTRDAALVVLLGTHATPEQAAAAGLTYTALIYWFLALIGMIALGRESLRAIRASARAGKLLAAKDAAASAQDPEGEA